jgi:Cu-Zn family superoxide dismutase
VGELRARNGGGASGYCQIMHLRHIQLRRTDRRLLSLGRSTTITGLSLAALVAAGCGGSDGSTSENATVETPPASLDTTTTVPSFLPGLDGDVFRAPGQASDDDAFTYDEVVVPVGSAVDIESEDEGNRTTVTVEAAGLTPNRDLGVHVHTRPCGPNPADSGPHYQNNVDPAAGPESPSTDPAYANPSNEVWLDITTDANGNAQSSATVDWKFREGEAQSVVIHADRTKIAPGEAGVAGDRLACIDEDF